MFTDPVTDAQIDPTFEATLIHDGGMLTMLERQERSENMCEVTPVSKMSRLDLTVALTALS